MTKEKTIVTSSSRIASLDLMRGLVMVLMTLGHIRGGLTASALQSMGALSPLGAQNPCAAFPDTSLILFYTRWLTNFCAPIFIFLAGVSIFLWNKKWGSTRNIHGYLFSRGCLVILINFSLYLPQPFTSAPLFMLNVLWPIGLAMIGMACVLALPKALLWTLSLGIILGQNFLDGISVSASPMKELWSLAFSPAQLSLPFNTTVFVMYPFVAWFAVMLLGYLCAPLFVAEHNRSKNLCRMGFVLLSGFALLRTGNLYGDAQHWQVYTQTWQTIASFINTTKYPPSLQFLLFHLGFMFLGLAWMEKYRVRSKFLLVLGSVPMLFYVTHHWVARIFPKAVLIYEGPDSLVIRNFFFSIEGVYVSTAVLLLVLYPCCLWWIHFLKNSRAKVQG